MKRDCCQIGERGEDTLMAREQNVGVRCEERHRWWVRKR